LKPRATFLSIVKTESGKDATPLKKSRGRKKFLFNPWMERYNSGIIQSLLLPGDHQSRRSCLLIFTILPPEK